MITRNGASASIYLPFFDLLSETFGRKEEEEEEEEEAVHQKPPTSDDHDSSADDEIASELGSRHFSFAEDFTIGRLVVGIDRSTVAVSAEPMLKKSVSIEESDEEEMEEEMDGKCETAKTDLVEEFVARSIACATHVRNSMSVKPRPKTTVVVLGKSTLESVGTDFLLALQRKIEEDTGRFRSEKLFFFNSEDGSFLHSPNQIDNGLRSRVSWVFKKQTWSTHLYRNKARNLALNTTHYLQVLSEAVEHGAESIEDYLCQLKAGSEGGVNQHLVEMHAKVLLNAHEQKLYKTEKGKDFSVHDVETLSGFEREPSNGLDCPTSETSEGETELDQAAADNSGVEPGITALAMMAAQSKEKPKTLLKVLETADRSRGVGDASGNTSDVEERVLSAWRGNLKLRDIRYRSNASMRGTFILTNKRLIASKKKFGFGPNIPMVAYVRPSNRATIIMLRILRFFGRIRKPLLAMFKGVGLPLLVGFIAVLRPIEEWAKGLPIDIPSIHVPGLDATIEFAVNNPLLVGAFFSALGGLSFAFLQALRFLFFRRRSIVTLPLSMLLGMKSNKKRHWIPELVCKPKGSEKLPGLDSGLPFRLDVHSEATHGVPSEAAESHIRLSLAASCTH